MKNSRPIQNGNFPEGKKKYLLYHVFYWIIEHMTVIEVTQTVIAVARTHRTVS